MNGFASTAVDLARLQFATTSIYHFLFVSLTLGLAPLVPIGRDDLHRPVSTLPGLEPDVRDGSDAASGQYELKVIRSRR